MAKSTAGVGVSLSQFEGEDLQAIRQAAQPKATPAGVNLVQFAKDNGLQVTGGFSTGGHNRGSRHYQGSAQDPGAVDVNHRGVDLAKLQQAAARSGVVVVDERQHPAGQARWTGPHYHLQKGASANGRAQANQSRRISPTQPKSGGNTQGSPAAGYQGPDIQAQPFDLGRPFGRPLEIGQDGKVRRASENQQDLAVQINKDLAQVNKAGKAALEQARRPVAIEGFEPATPEDNAIVDQFMSTLKQKSGPLKPLSSAAPPIHKPGLIEAIAKAPGQLVEQLRQGAADMVGQAGHQPQDLGDAISRYVPTAQPIAGAVSEAANLINGITGLPAEIGNAMGGDYESIIPKIPTGALEEFTAKNPFGSTLGRLLPYAAGEGLVLKAGQKIAPGLVSAITRTAPGRIAGAAGVNAVEGGLVDPGEGGIAQRAANAVTGGVLGGITHGAVEGVGRLARGAEIPASTEMPGYRRQKEITDLQVNGQPVGAASELNPNPFQYRRDGQPIAPRTAMNPDLATENPVDLAESFQARQQSAAPDLAMPAPEQGATKINILGADGRPVVSVEQGLPTAAQRAGERFQESASQELNPQIVRGTALPEGRKPAGQIVPSGDSDPVDLSISGGQELSPQEQAQLHAAGQKLTLQNTSDVVREFTSKGSSTGELPAVEQFNELGFEVSNKFDPRTQRTRKAVYLNKKYGWVYFDKDNTISGVMDGLRTLWQGNKSLGNPDKIVGKVVDKYDNAGRLRDMLGIAQDESQLLGESTQETQAFYRLQEDSAAKDLAEQNSQEADHAAYAQEKADKILSEIDAAKTQEELDAILSDANRLYAADLMALPDEHYYDLIEEKSIQAEKRIQQGDTTPLRSSSEIVMQGTPPSEPTTPDLARESIPTENDLAYKGKSVQQPKDLAAPKEGNVIDFPGRPKPVESSGIVDASGNPIRDLAGPLPKEKLPGNAKMKDLVQNNQVDIPTGRPAESSPTESGSVHVTEQGGEVFTQRGSVDRAKTLAAAIEKVKKDGSQNQILSFQEAQKLIREKQKMGVITPEQAGRQLDHLRNFVEAGKNGKTYDFDYNQLQRGRGNVGRASGVQGASVRQGVSPFAIHLQTITPETEIKNLLTELGSMDAVVQNLSDRAARYGIQSKAVPISAQTIIKRMLKDGGDINSVRAQLRQRVTDLGLTPTTQGKTAIANAQKLAQQLREHPDAMTEFVDPERAALDLARQIRADRRGVKEFSNIYLDAHNPRTGEAGKRSSGILGDTPGNYRLDTVERSNVGLQDTFIPSEVASKNVIKEHFDTLRDLATSPDLPEDARKFVANVLEKPEVTHTDIAKMRNALNKIEHLEEFCRLFGLDQ